MASYEIQNKILKHLSAQSDTWAATISKVAKEVGAGSLFVEAAMKHLVENGKLVRANDGATPTYKAPAPVQGKYSTYTDTRFNGNGYPNTKTGTFEDNPNFEPITSRKAV